MRIEKSECNYQVTECDLKFGEQITLDGQLLILASILDKIRSEIEQTNETVDGFLMHDGTKRTVLRIIDKYKADKKPTCGECKEWGTVNCSETYREPTKDDDICESFKAESEE